MSWLKDKNDVTISVGDYIDVRLRVTEVDELGRTIIARLGGGQLGLGNGTTNPSPDSGRIITFKPGDVVKV